MRYLFLILVLSGLLVQNFSRLVIVLNFEMNREYIAKNSCEKRNVANNCCKGSCQLKKQLDNENEKEKQSGPNTIKEKYEAQLFCQDFFLFRNPTPPDTEKNKTAFCEHFTDVSLRSVFHPPETMVLML